MIDFVLSHTIRLFHPFLPFITEELWHGMGYATDMPEHQGGKTIMNAPWPKPFDADLRDAYSLDDCYLEFATQKYEVVTQGRNLRRVGNIQAGKKVKFVLKPTREVLPHDAEVIKILLKLNEAIREVSTALDEYNFSVAVQALYRFFWNEYCDWYVEASKAVFFGTDEARKANTLAVIDFVLSHTIRLFHPFLPFITEELWHGKIGRAHV